MASRAASPPLAGSTPRLVQRLRRTERATWALGGALTLAGLAYAGWGVARFDPRADVKAHASFDAPVSSLVHMYDAYRPLLRAARPKTELEALLHRGLERQMAFSAGMLITLVRLFLGALAALMGLVTFAVLMERRRLLRLVEGLLQASGSAAPGAAPLGGEPAPDFVGEG